MSRWIVTHVPSGLLLVGLMLFVAGGAVLVSIIARRRFPALTGSGHNEAIKFTYGFIGFVYAFFIGFVVSSMWGQINTADENARDEGAAAVQMAANAAHFETADADRIRRGLAGYANAAIAEWSQGAGERSPAADAALVQLASTYQQVTPSTDAQKTMLATSSANLETISEARTVRLLTAREDAGPPWPLWVVIFLTSALVLGSIIVYGVEKHRMHYPMVFIVGLIVAANLFLILELSHPYVGDIATSPDPLQEVVRVLDRPAS